MEILLGRRGGVAPWGGGDHDELVEAVGAEDGGDGAGHGGEGVADEDAFVDAELVEDGEQVVGEALEGSVAVEVEVVGVGGAGAHVVVDDDLVAVHQVGNQVLPHGLVGTESVPEDDDCVAAAEDADVVGF